MTPKEKAKELVDKMYMLDDPNGNYPMCFDIAKECALVAVDEIIKSKPYWNTQEEFEYWYEVKHEIEKL